MFKVFKFIGLWCLLATCVTVTNLIPGASAAPPVKLTQWATSSGSSALRFGYTPRDTTNSISTQTGRDTTSKPAPSKQPKRSKLILGLGAALLGGGIALVAVNPDLTRQYQLDSRGNLVRQGYHARLTGGVMIGFGGLCIWRGMERR